MAKKYGEKEAKKRGEERKELQARNYLCKAGYKEKERRGKGKEGERESEGKMGNFMAHSQGSAGMYTHTQRHH